MTIKKITRLTLILLFLCVFLLNPHYHAKADTLITTVGVGANPVHAAINETTNKIYVANRNSNNISVIDGNTNTVINTIAVGAYPRKIAVNPVTNKIYVANYNGWSVSVINGSTDTLIKNINIGTDSYPIDIGVNATTNKIYTANLGTGGVTVINGTNDTISKSHLATGLEPNSLVIDETTNKIYVANGSDYNLSAINGVTDTLITNIELVPPDSASMSNLNINKTTQKIYARGGQYLNIFNAANNTFIDKVTIDVATDCVYNTINESLNKIYTSDPWKNILYVFDGATNTKIRQINIESGNFPRFLKYNPVNNRVYLANRDSNSIKIINSANDSIIETINVGGQPDYISINETTNKIYVLNYSGNSISIIDGGEAVPLLPSIDSLNPLSGPIGSSVIIAGTNFGAIQGTSTVKFNGTTATITNWSDTSITVTVPAGATTGDVIVTTTTGTSNSIGFEVTVSEFAPKITSLSQYSGYIGDIITINGTGFRNTQQDALIKFNGVLATNIISWSETQITVKVPNGTTNGMLTISNPNKSRGIFFAITSTAVNAPIINFISSPAVQVGGMLTIYGEKFGTYSTSGYEVVINGIKMGNNIKRWENNRIMLYMPPLSGNISGEIIVIANGKTSNSKILSISGTINTVQPLIFGLESTTVYPMEDIEIWGKGFTFTGGTVNFPGGITMTISDVKSWSDTLIKLKVPQGISSGNLTITTINGTSNAVILNVKNPQILTIHSTSGNSGYSNEAAGRVGDTIIVHGIGFGNYLAGNPNNSHREVVFPGNIKRSIEDIVSSTNQGWWDNQIKVTIPTGVSASGNIIIKTEGGQSIPYYFKFVPVTPKINFLSSYSGNRGSTVEINGAGFGSIQGKSTISFYSGGLAKTNAQILSWTDSKVVAVVPNVIQKENSIRVNAEGFISSNAARFYVLDYIQTSITGGPVISGVQKETLIYPDYEAGETIIINGKNFGDYQEGSFLMFPNDIIVNNIISWSDTQIRVSIPAETETGYIYIVREPYSLESNPAFVRIRIPVINTIDYSPLKPGGNIILKGIGFGENQGASEVYFNNIKANTILKWTNNQVAVQVPSELTTNGQIKIETPCYTSNGIVFTISPF